MTTTPDVRDVLHSWTSSAHPGWRNLEIEDDTLRDGLQGAFVRKPSLAEKQELLALSARLGAQNAMLGFPAISVDELAECRALVRFIVEQKLAIIPRFLARAKVEDVEPIAQLNDEFGVDVEADYFIGTSPIRRHVERWELADILTKVAEIGRYLVGRKAPFGVSIEDASRTPPDDLAQILDVAFDTGTRVITICDTVGDSTPQGATRLIEFVRERAQKRNSAVKLWWHGHNDRGLALANAIAAVEAGVHAVSGSFLGIGERTGNTALEQLLMFAHQSGNSHFRVQQLHGYCEKLARYTRTPLADNAPLVGEQAFATCTGTHSAAILKARSLGIDFEDYIFSGVPASKLGRSQNILIGPTSGLANARYVLEALGLTAGDEQARLLLQHAKTKDRFLRTEEIQSWVKGRAA